VNVQGSRVAGNWIADPALNPYHVVDGHAPQADNEVVIDRARWPRRATSRSGTRRS
jgi:hypothetical protein